MKIDLHVHSLESDGILSVQEIIDIAYQANVRIMALTDHESTNGIETAQKLARRKGIKIIPGIEFSSDYHGQEIHLLGYFTDINNNRLQDRLAMLRKQRTRIAQKMVKKLQANGFYIDWEDVEIENRSNIAIGKGHIMRTLYHKNGKHKELTWPMIADMFQPGGKAYIPFLENPFTEAVDLIHQNGGVPVLAHPGLIRQQKLIDEILSQRNIGLEVYYGYWENQKKLIDHYFHIAKDKKVLMTGGSDFHGPFSKVGIGQIDVPIECVHRIFDVINI